MPSHTGHLIRHGDEQWKTGFINGIIVGSIIGTILAIALHRFRH